MQDCELDSRLALILCEFDFVVRDCGRAGEMLDCINRYAGRQQGENWNQLEHRSAYPELGSGHRYCHRFSAGSLVLTTSFVCALHIEMHAKYVYKGGISISTGPAVSSCGPAGGVGGGERHGGGSRDAAGQSFLHRTEDRLQTNLRQSSFTFCS